MNHLEKLVSQFYAWRGYLVRGNVKVGALAHGGWEGELDVVAYHPQVGHLIHLEPSLDADPWPRREARFQKKFELGRRYICQDVFPWLEPATPVEQVAILVSASRRELGGGRVVSIDEFMAEVKDAVLRRGPLSRGAIPEEYDLLRTLQLALCGYVKAVEP
ncbi:hypothetical protein JCM13664_04150 [Methylothermus subterraneus]